jgi:hypothetical protein
MPDGQGNESLKGHSANQANGSFTGNIEGPTPAGPHSDPVFRSLPAAGEETLHVDAPPASREGRAVLLARNIYTLAPAGNVSASSERVIETPQDSGDENTEMLAQLEQADHDAIYAVSEEFVNFHVRRLAKDVALRAPHPDFAKGSTLISYKNVPTSKLRHATFQWAITEGRVVELRNVRLPVAHLEPFQGTTSLNLRGRLSGDDVAVFLACVLDTLDITPPHSVAAVGDIATNTNELLFVQDVDPLLEAAKEEGMHDVILPRHNQKTNGMHGPVCYWPSKDTDSAIFSVMSTMGGETINPNLVRRAFTKQAYSWGSLICALLAVGGYQLAVALGGNPPVNFVRFLLGLAGLFLIGSIFCTHRYWILDR